jgi:hypothetical protein
MKAIILIAALFTMIYTYGQDATGHPAHQDRSKTDPRAAAVDSRGDHAMGFSHETTSHHFTLLKNGGIISVGANAAHDDATVDEIRIHLKHIASMFRANNFNIPMFIHDKIPPGVETMKEKHAHIRYTYIPTQNGAKVRIVTHDAAGLEAVHEFLKFQIEDHRTGDSKEIRPSS